MERIRNTRIRKILVSNRILYSKYKTKVVYHIKIIYDKKITRAEEEGVGSKRGRILKSWMKDFKRNITTRGALKSNI